MLRRVSAFALTAMVVCLASSALAAPCSAGVCNVPGACFGQLVDSAQLNGDTRPMYIGKPYSFVYEYVGAPCPDINNNCPEYVATVVAGTQQNFDFVGGTGSLRLSGVRQQDSFIIRPNDVGLIAANWTCASPCTDASSPLYVYDKYALQVPCDGSGSSTAQYRTLSLVAPAQTAVVFEQWSDPYTLTIDDDAQLLDGQEAMTLQLRVMDGTNTDRTSSCEFDPPSTSVTIDANTPTVRFAVRCHYAQNTLVAGAYTIQATIASATPASVEGYFYDITPMPSPKPVFAAALNVQQQRIHVALHSTGNEAVAGGSPLSAGVGNVFVLDTHNRVHTAFVGSTTVTLVFPGQTVTPNTLQITPGSGAAHQTFTYTANVPTTAGDAASLVQDVPLTFGEFSQCAWLSAALFWAGACLRFLLYNCAHSLPLCIGISNTDQFTIANIDGSSQSTFDFDLPSFASFGVNTVEMRVDQMIAIPLVLRQPLATGGQVNVLISNNDDGSALRFSLDPAAYVDFYVLAWLAVRGADLSLTYPFFFPPHSAPTSFTPTLTVSFAAGAATGQVYYVRVDANSWQSVTTADSATYTIHHELQAAGSGAGAVEAPSDINVQVDRMQFYIDVEHHSADGQDLLRGVPVRVAITVAAAPPSSVTITPYVRSGLRVCLMHCLF